MNPFRLSRRRFLSACASCAVLGLLPNVPALPQAGRRWKKKSDVSPEPARHYKNLDADTTQCRLCPNACIRRPGDLGKCKARGNIEGRYYSMVYNSPCLIHLDKIEKLPMYHFMPGINVFSVATAGCNLTCKYCQNWQFSQSSPYETENLKITPMEIIRKAGDAGCNAIAFFYTEPVVYFEYMTDIAVLAKKAGMKTIMVTAGYIQEAPLKEILPLIDAVTFGLKGFSDSYYRDIVGGKLEHVLEALRWIDRSGVWCEIVNLIVPTLNDNADDIRRMCEWIGTNLSKNRPVHFTRFVPEYLLRNIPMTPQRTLEKARDIGYQSGLSYVYTGNLPGHEGNNTHCPRCHQILIRRIGIHLKSNSIRNNRCPHCGTPQNGLWA